jgi:hypothetical protein
MHFGPALCVEGSQFLGGALLGPEMENREEDEEDEEDGRRWKAGWRAQAAALNA